ncbi:MAG: hypothetical protein QOE11_3236 [Solirubrobacteraceae bacterium]|jgi:anti-sigma B factor antagonist|nr:hypothetical protein [Solirubrobacteraceae bacterium]
MSSDGCGSGALHDPPVHTDLGVTDHRLAAAPCPPPDFTALTLSSVREGDAHHICPFGELDLASVPRLEYELAQVERTDAPRIVLDLSGLLYVDSTAVRLLLDANARSRAAGGRLTLRRGQAQVQRVFELLGVAEILPFAD